MPTEVSRLTCRQKVRDRLDSPPQRFGRLVVVKFGGYAAWRGTRYQQRRLWVCRCDCDGNEATYREDFLKSGWVRSCGCLRGRGLKDGAGLTPLERLHARKRGRVEASRRAEELVFVGPWRDLLERFMGERELSRGLLATRCGWKLDYLGEFLERRGPRCPSAEQAQLLAQALNLRGLEKLEFLRLAKEARELVAKKRSVTTVAARAAIFAAHGVAAREEVS